MNHLHKRSPKDVRFDQRAAAYDRGIEGKLSRRFYRLLIRDLNVPDGARVLDVGCGTGALLRLIADRCTIEGYGIDMEPAMIEQAMKNCPEMDIRTSRCEATPFEDSTFDVLSCCMAYHHFSDKPGFAKEAARILKPGGQLIIADPHFPSIMRKLLNGVFQHIGLVGEFLTPDEIGERFSAYGFVLDAVAIDGYAQVVRLCRT